MWVANMSARVGPSPVYFESGIMFDKKSNVGMLAALIIIVIVVIGWLIQNDSAENSDTSDTASATAEPESEPTAVDGDGDEPTGGDEGDGDGAGDDGDADEDDGDVDEGDGAGDSKGDDEGGGDETLEVTKAPLEIATIENVCLLVLHKPMSTLENYPSTVVVGLKLETPGSGTIALLVPPAYGGEPVITEFTDTNLVTVGVPIDAYGSYSFESAEYTSLEGETVDLTADVEALFDDFEVGAEEGPLNFQAGCEETYDSLTLP